MDLADNERAERLCRILRGAVWATIFLAAIIVYWPGLQGPFVLDDLTNISALGHLGGVRDWETFKAFVFGGSAGPTGRPMALLSFLIDGRGWPVDPWPFKRTNLVIHLVNGALLGVVTRQILAILQYSKSTAAWIALASTAAWMLHPFLVSTTLYSVQRMAQLAMLFALAGMASYLYGRSLLVADKTRAYVIMTLSLGTFTVLATLSKENGILLPTLIGAVEISVIASRGDKLPALDRRWVIAFLVLPTTMIVLYLLQSFLRADFLEVAVSRDFSLYERLLTQPRVVADYLQHWFLPKLYTTGVFQDHVPLLAFAILFFYVNHLLESTVLNLEMYFEHRNYLASSFLFLPIIAIISKKLDRRAGVMVTGVALLVLASFTHYSATIWSDYNDMVEASAARAPTSPRAQVQYSLNLFNAGYPEASLQAIDRAIENIPTGDPLLSVNRLLIRCNMQLLEPTDFDAVIAQLSSRDYDPRHLTLYSTLVSALAEPRCPEISLERVRPLFAGMLDNPNNLVPGSLSLSHVHYLSGLVAVKLSQQAAARQHFKASLDANPEVSSAMMMAGLMATHGFFEDALMFADIAQERLDAVSAASRLSAKVTEADISQFRATVRAEMGNSD
jgi:phage-related holin